MAFFLLIGVSDLTEIFFESDLDIADADIKVSNSLFELSASESEVAFHLVEESIIDSMIDSRVIGIEEAASMDGFNNFITVLLPASTFAQKPGEIDREGVVLREMPG